VWDVVVRKKGWVYFLFIFKIFFNEYFFSKKYFIEINVYFLGMEKFQHKNLTKRKKMFKIEHLIHLTNKMGEKNQFDFFACLILFMYIIKKS
jgi:hypothetical protein